MLRCEKCKHMDVSGKKYPCSECDSVVNDLFEAKKTTNADRIRSMSEEELLDFICSIETYDDGSVKTIEGGSALCSVSDVKEWLQSEVNAKYER